jgi:hypothetical protein
MGGLCCSGLVAGLVVIIVLLGRRSARDNLEEENRRLRSEIQRLKENTS